VAIARGWKVLAVTAIGVYLVSLDVTVVNIAFPAIMADFEGSSRASLSWVLSAYNITFAAALLTAGRMADRLGRRRIFFLGIGVFTFGSALCGIAPSPNFLIAARVVQAVGAAMVLPTSLALVLPEFPVERRSAAIGVWGAVGGVAAATGPSLGSTIIETVGWRWVFFINTPLCLAAYLVGRRMLVESKDPTASGQPDVLGALLGAAAVALLVLGIVQGEEWGYSDARILGAVAAAAVLLPLFILRCRTAPTPVLDLTLLRQRFFAVGNLAGFLFAVAFFSMLFVNVQWLVGVWGYSILGAGFALTPGPLTAAVFAGPAGRWADRYGHRKVIVPGTLLYALGLGLLAVRIQPEPDYWAVMFPSNLLVGAGVGLTISTLSSASNAYLPPTRFAMGSAFNATVRQIGAALGIAVAVAMLGTAVGGDVEPAFRRTWFTMAAIALSAGVVMLALYRRPIAEVEPGAALSTEPAIVAT
jgi:EmrB/QacA subfamily drug resistance transporter